jgi:uncharacterized protein YbaA (DUF1428 family)
MPNYVDGFVMPLPSRNLAAYKAMAGKAGKIFKEHGALDYWECVGDDLEGKGMLSFTRMAKAKADETVIFAWVVYRSRKHRDRVNAKVMSDPRLTAMCDPKDPLFDFKKMAYGGFAAIVHR